MRLFGLNRRHSETLLLAIGQLVLIAYIFQVAAFDHWHTDISSISGVAESSAHAATHESHCHGSPSSCADSGSGFAQVSADQVVRLPAAASSLVLDADSSTQVPEDVLLLLATEPPKVFA